jgi:hypothetical protein
MAALSDADRMAYNHGMLFDVQSSCTPSPSSTQGGHDPSDSESASVLSCHEKPSQDRIEHNNRRSLSHPMPAAASTSMSSSSRKELSAMPANLPSRETEIYKKDPATLPFTASGSGQAGELKMPDASREASRDYSEDLSEHQFSAEALAQSMQSLQAAIGPAKQALAQLAENQRRCLCLCLYPCPFTLYKCKGPGKYAAVYESSDVCNLNVVGREHSKRSRYQPSEL